MIENELLKINIELLKMNLEGPTKEMSIITDSKGKKFEECFRYYALQPEQGGNCIENFENNSLLFNYRKEKRQFDVCMLGFVEIKKDLDKEPNLVKYDFYEPGIINLKYDSIEIEYDAINMQFKKNKEIISQDISEELKELARNKSDKSYKGYSTLYEKAEMIIEKEAIPVKDITSIEITKDEVLTYIKNVNKFLKKIKSELNEVQKGYPNLIKFVRLNMDNKSENEIFMFHIFFRREIDAAFRVKQNYDFSQYSGFEEINLYEKKEKTIFKENDILLFELKNTTNEIAAVTCINSNYYIINAHIKLLKEKKEFKDCRFFYIGIKEMKTQNPSNKKVKTMLKQTLEEIRKKEEHGILKVKLFEFINDNIFNMNLNDIKFNKIETYDLLKYKFAEIDNKINAMNNDMNKKINCFIFFMLVILIPILITICFKK